MANWHRMRERAEQHEPYEPHVTLRATDDSPDVAPDAAERTGLGFRLLLIVLAIVGLIGALMLHSIFDEALGRTPRPGAPAQRGR
jgi:hypothetical protein